MATPKSNPLSENIKLSKKLAETLSIGIVYTEWNSEVISKLLKGAVKTLNKLGITKEQIIEKQLPGSFELPLGAQYLIKYSGVNAVICLGCIIKGETPHFHYISSAVSDQLLQISVSHNLPLAFGVLTVDNIDQALERAGGKHGNKGSEAALTVLKMLLFKDDLFNHHFKNTIGLKK